jgi:hypothetical protein
MADRTLATNQTALADAALISLAIADPDATPTPTVGHLRLFDETLTPDVTTTQADLEAAETILGGYPAGGYEIAAMIGLGTSPGGGALLTTPAIPISYTVAPGATIGGGWIEKADGSMGQVFIFDPVRPLQNPGDAFVFIRQLLYDRNS